MPSASSHLPSPPSEIYPAAFESLRLPIRNHLKRRGVFGAEREDLEQAAMIRIWNSRHRLDPGRDPKQYALRTAENLVRDRRRYKPKPISLEAPLGEDGRTVGDLVADPIDGYEGVREERTETGIGAGLRELLSQLSALDRDTLLLYSEGLPRAEAAAKAGITLATYGARIYRAQRRARLLLPKFADHFPA